MNKSKRVSAAPLGASLIVLSSFFYGLYGVWTKLMGDAFGSYMQAGLRCSVVVIVLGAIAYFRKQLQPIQWRRDRKWLFIMCCTPALISAPLYFATLQIGVGLATAVNYAGLVISMFAFGWLFSRERFTKDKMLATALGLIGLWCIFAPHTQGIGLLGLFLALISGVATSLNIVTTQKIPYSAAQSTLLTWTASVPINFAVAFAISDRLPSLTGNPMAWLYVFLFGLTGLAASWAIVKGVKMIDAGAAGILGLLEIVFGVLFGVILFAERPSLLAIIGMGIIVLAAAIPYVQEYRLKMRSPQV